MQLSDEQLAKFLPVETTREMVLNRFSNSYGLEIGQMLTFSPGITPQGIAALTLDLDNHATIENLETSKQKTEKRKKEKILTSWINSTLPEEIELNNGTTLNPEAKELLITSWTKNGSEILNAFNRYAAQISAQTKCEVIKHYAGHETSHTSSEEAPSLTKEQKQHLHDTMGISSTDLQEELTPNFMKEISKKLETNAVVNEETQTFLNAIRTEISNFGIKLP